MASIGATLRDTRIRKKIDISSVEGATKIRAKYLRALENEEWAVLPGPTYVKSFVRTYAEYLGLDPHLLIEEYNTRYEEPEELEVAAFTSEKPMRRQVRRVPTVPRWAVVVGVIVLLLAFLIVLGVTGNNDDKGTSDNQSKQATPVEPKQGATKQDSSTQAGGDLVRLTVIPTRDVWVCVVDAKGRQRIDGRVLSGGDRQGPYTSKRLTMTIGNGGGDFSVNGRKRNVPESSEPVGYVVTASKVKPLSRAKRPACGQ